MSAQPKKAANLTVRADLLEEARAYKINLSQTLETAQVCRHPTFFQHRAVLGSLYKG